VDSYTVVLLELYVKNVIYTYHGNDSFTNQRVGVLWGSCYSNITSTRYKTVTGYKEFILDKIQAQKVCNTLHYSRVQNDGCLVARHDQPSKLKIYFQENMTKV
jgi:hypothetical protein